MGEWRAHVCIYNFVSPTFFAANKFPANRTKTNCDRKRRNKTLASRGRTWWMCSGCELRATDVWSIELWHDHGMMWALSRRSFATVLLTIVICEKWTAEPCRGAQIRWRQWQRRRWRQWRRRINIQRKTFVELYLCLSFAAPAHIAAAIWVGYHLTEASSSSFGCRRRRRHFRIFFMVTTTADRWRRWRRRRLVFNSTLQRGAFPCVNFFYLILVPESSAGATPALWLQWVLYVTLMAQSHFPFTQHLPLFFVWSECLFVSSLWASSTSYS